MEPIAAAVRALVAEHLEPPLRDDDPLELPSLSLIVIAEELERRYGLVVAARELNADNFGSIAGLAAFVARKAGSAR